LDRGGKAVDELRQRGNGGGGLAVSDGIDQSFPQRLDRMATASGRLATLIRSVWSDFQINLPRARIWA
jgi:hypothetical protein